MDETDALYAPVYTAQSAAPEASWAGAAQRAARVREAKRLGRELERAPAPGAVTLAGAVFAFYLLAGPIDSTTRP
jgi:hypothetical protein